MRHSLFLLVLTISLILVKTHAADARTPFDDQYRSGLGDDIKPSSPGQTDIFIGVFTKVLLCFAVAVVVSALAKTILKHSGRLNRDSASPADRSAPSSS
jgi:hypothetical protein